jgi:hypothetical protein
MKDSFISMHQALPLYDLAGSPLSVQELTKPSSQDVISNMERMTLANCALFSVWLS